MKGEIGEWVPANGAGWGYPKLWCVQYRNADGSNTLVALIPDCEESKGIAEEICFLHQQKSPQWGAADEYAMAQLENRVDAAETALRNAKHAIQAALVRIEVYFEKAKG